jgi:hypothetical protein
LTAASNTPRQKNSYALVLYTIFRMTLIGLVRSVQLRPITPSSDVLRARTDLHWRLDIPRALIERIEFGRVPPPLKRSAAICGRLRDPNVMIELRAPLRARGPSGIEPSVQRVGLTLDDVSAFEKPYDMTTV